MELQRPIVSWLQLRNEAKNVFSVIAEVKSVAA
jgi:hypothetical protein